VTYLKVLKDKYAGYNTYQIKIEKNRKIVIRGLHSQAYFKSIAEELQMLNHQVKTIADITKFDTKQPLPLLLAMNLNPNATIFIYNVKPSYNIAFVDLVRIMVLLDER
jgi:hypothetical protein